MKYFRRLHKQIVWWQRVYSSYNVRNADVIYQPKVHQIIGTAFEKPFYILRESSCPCSCSLCRESKYKRNRSGRGGYVFEIQKQIEDESSCNWFSRIH